MEGSYPSKLRVWDGWLGAVTHDPGAPGTTAALDLAHPLQGPHGPAQLAERLYFAEALVRPPAARDQGPEPYSLQWFLDIETRRHGRLGRWIPRLLEFTKHASETLLGLGHGLGTDWLQYARHGASVVVCSPSGAQLALVRRNFELRGLAGRFLHASPMALPLESASIDVACVSGLLEIVADPLAVVNEVYRLLKPGGKVLAVTPARYDVDFWRRLCFFWKRRPSQVVPPQAARFSARRLRRLFGRFVEHRIHKRQLRRAEVPHLWRLLPLPLLERLLGRVLVLKAFKPLSCALPPVRVAA
ncbi:MAG: class I SAM-dependent methyltransferase [Gemmataceae bacterium]|nr:class I SAM-dependent methyltransferase [Gemmataceae bacterium]